MRTNIVYNKLKERSGSIYKSLFLTGCIMVLGSGVCNLADNPGHFYDRLEKFVTLQPMDEKTDPKKESQLANLIGLGLVLGSSVPLILRRKEE